MQYNIFLPNNTRLELLTMHTSANTAFTFYTKFDCLSLTCDIWLCCDSLMIN